MARITEICWDNFGNTDVADKLQELEFGASRTEFLADELAEEVGQPDGGTNKAFILATEIQIKVEDLRATISRLGEEWCANIKKVSETTDAETSEED